MRADDDLDPLLLEIRRLPVLTPDERRAAQLRTRCRAALEREPATRRLLGPVVFASLCAIYLAALVVDILRLRARS